MLSLGPAPPDVGFDDPLTADLTKGAPGAVLDLRLSEPASFVPRAGRDRRTKVVEASRILFTPSRPGAVLDEAARRRLAQ